MSKHEGLREWIDALTEHAEGAETLDAEGMRLLRTILREERIHTLLDRGEELEAIEDSLTGTTACLGDKLREAYNHARGGSPLERLLDEASEAAYALEGKDDLAVAVDLFLRDVPHLVGDPRRLSYALQDLSRAEHEASGHKNPVLVP